MQTTSGDKFGLMIIKLLFIPIIYVKLNIILQCGNNRVRKATENPSEQGIFCTIPWPGIGRREAREGSRRPGRTTSPNENQLLPDLPSTGAGSRRRSSHRRERLHFHSPQHGPRPATLLRGQMGDGEMCSQLHNHAHRRHLRDPQQPEVQEYSSQGAGEQGEG